MKPPDANTITLWIEELCADNADAQELVWEIYSQRIVDYAKEKIPKNQRRVADEDDVACQVFNWLDVDEGEVKGPSIVNQRFCSIVGLNKTKFCQAKPSPAVLRSSRCIFGGRDQQGERDWQDGI